MKPAYYSGSWTTDGDKDIEDPSPGLVVGGMYLIEEYTHWESHNGNGGSSYSSPETSVKVYNPITRKLISEQENPHAFRKEPAKNCSHKNLVFLSSRSKIERCQNCYKTFTRDNKLIEVEENES